MVLTAGCGGASEHKPFAHTKPATRFSANQVGAFFKDVTGDSLEADTSVAFDSLSADHSDDERSGRMTERYGTFLIFVLHRSESESIYRTQDGRAVEPDANGVYWHDEGGSWTAMKPYHNVVLSWSAGTRTLDERFERLDAVLSKLKVGATVTTVERNQRLTLPDMEVKVFKVQTGQLVVPPREYGLVRRAKGRFLLAGIRIKNTGNEPLRSTSGIKLKIGQRIYDQSLEASWTVTPLDAFPLQPGDTTNAAVVFDLPLTAAREALTDGVLAFPTAEDAAALGQIRLAAPRQSPSTKS